jgi:TonB family protein
MGADDPNEPARQRPARARGRFGLGGSLALSAGIHGALMGCGLLVVVGHAHRRAEAEPDTTAILVARVAQDPAWYQQASQPAPEAFAAALAEEPAPEALELEAPTEPLLAPIPLATEVEVPALEVEAASELDAAPASDVDWSDVGSESLADLRDLRAPRGSVGAGAGGVAGAGAGSGIGTPGSGQGGFVRGPGAGPDFRPGGARGGGAVAAVAAPQGESRAVALLESPRPPYPRISLRLNEEGSVLVRIHVDADGRVSSVEVLESSGFERLDEAAKAGVRSWRFEPALQGGKPVAGTYDHRIIFVIERAG